MRGKNLEMGSNMGPLNVDKTNLMCFKWWYKEFSSSSSSLKYLECCQTAEGFTEILLQKQVRLLLYVKIKGLLKLFLITPVVRFANTSVQSHTLPSECQAALRFMTNFVLTLYVLRSSGPLSVHAGLRISTVLYLRPGFMSTPPLF